MQLDLLLVLGSAMASAKACKKALAAIATLAHDKKSAILVTTFVSTICCWLNWGFGLIAGALLAKGRLLGVQFDTLFTNNLYGEVGRVAIAAADELRRILREAGCTFFRESPTNQQFVVLENAQVEALAERIRFSTWEKLGDGRTVIRLVTSWSTTPDDLAALEAALHEVMQ